MDTNKSSHQELSQWLRTERCISAAIIKAAGLSSFSNHGKGMEICIPVRNQHGSLLFHKFRRDPKNTEGPKYRYEKGATASLFGAETLANLKPNDVLVITEGELDSLAVRTLGLNAVSSTGGAGTWNVEWNDLIKDFDVVILYDADKAGIEGALKVAAKIPGASIAWLPVQHGKDPTEVIRSGNADAIHEAVQCAVKYRIDFSSLDSMKDIHKELLLERGESLSDPDGTPFHQDIALDFILKKIHELKDLATVARRPRDPDMKSKIDHARTYPMKNLIKVNAFKKSLCVWHTEKNPSMHVYDDHVYCFSCGRGGDAIDIYMIINKCDFKTAVQKLS